MTDPVANDDDDLPPAPGAAVATAPSGKQRALLALVITLGVLILLAFAVLVGGLVMGVGSASDRARPWSYSLDVPKGTRIIGSELDGNRILLRLRAPEGDDVVVLDAASGKVLGRIQVKPPR